MHTQFTVLLWNIQAKQKKSATFFASFFLFMCLCESQSSVFLQDELLAMLLCWYFNSLLGG